mgnify:CR=1 FL=1
MVFTNKPGKEEYLTFESSEIVEKCLKKYNLDYKLCEKNGTVYITNPSNKNSTFHYHYAVGAWRVHNKSTRRFSGKGPRGTRYTVKDIETLINKHIIKRIDKESDLCEKSVSLKEIKDVKKEIKLQPKKQKRSFSERLKILFAG